MTTKTATMEPETTRRSNVRQGLTLPVYTPSDSASCPQGHRPPSIRVSRRDMRDAVPGDAHRCAIAIPAMSQMTGLLDAEVQRSVAYFEYEDHFDKFFTGVRSRRAVIRFDLAGAAGFGEPGLYPMLAVPFWRTAAGRRAAKHPTLRPQGSVPQRGNRGTGGVDERRRLTALGVRDGSVNA